MALNVYIQRKFLKRRDFRCFLVDHLLHTSLVFVISRGQVHLRSHIPHFVGTRVLQRIRHLPRLLERRIAAAKPHLLLAHLDDPRFALLNKNLRLLEVYIEPQVLNFGVYPLDVLSCWES